MDYSGYSPDLVFNLDIQSAFSFKCQVCSACCYNKAIPVGPYEALRLSRRLGMTTTDFYRRCTEQGTAILRNKPDGSCFFLSAGGCGAHPDRPLVCRLFPLGKIVDSGGNEKFSIMPLHPDCVGLLGEDETVESYFMSQGSEPYFHYDGVYAALHKRILEALSRRRERGTGRMAGERQLHAHGTRGDFPWQDVDATVEAFCRRLGLPKPDGLEELVALHFEALAEWLAAARA